MDAVKGSEPAAAEAGAPGPAERADTAAATSQQPGTEDVDGGEDTRTKSDYRLTTGAYAFPLVGLAPEVLASVATGDLRSTMFSVLPTDIRGWQSMSKKALRRAMVDMSFNLMREEKDRRRKARAAAAADASPSSQLPRKRPRPAGGAQASSARRAAAGAGEDAAASGRHSSRGVDPAWLAAWASAPRVVIDCSFQELMKSTEKRSLNMQIRYAYGYTRRSRSPLQLVLTSLTPEHLTDIARQQADGGSWPCHMFAQHFLDVFAAPAGEQVPLRDVRETSGGAVGDDAGVAGSSDSTSSSEALPWPRLTSCGKDNLVYLTADADTVIHALDPSKVYIVGGLVDRNRHKGITAARAQAAGIATAKLPLDDHIDMTASKALTTNHVVEILQRFHDTGDWRSAITSTVPMRKTKTGAGEAEDEEGAEEDATVTAP